MHHKLKINALCFYKPKFKPMHEECKIIIRGVSGIKNGFAYIIISLEDDASYVVYLNELVY